MDANHGSNECRASLLTVAESVNVQVEKRACKRNGCRTHAAEDSEFCEEHERRQRQYNAAYAARRRAEWARTKRCTNCGAAKRRPKSKWCSACIVRDRRMKIPSVNQQVENKAQRVAARMIAWVNSPQNAGRVRLRGGSKGRPTIEAENRLDVDDLQKNVLTAVDALALADSAETASLPPIQRQNTRHAAAGWWLLIARQALVIAKRNGGGLPESVEEILGESSDDEET